MARRGHRRGRSLRRRLAGGPVPVFGRTLRGLVPGATDRGGGARVRSPGCRGRALRRHCIGRRDQRAPQHRPGVSHSIGRVTGVRPHPPHLPMVSRRARRTMDANRGCAPVRGVGRREDCQRTEVRDGLRLADGPGLSPGRHHQHGAHRHDRSADSGPEPDLPRGVLLHRGYDGVARGHPDPLQRLADLRCRAGGRNGAGARHAGAGDRLLLPRSPVQLLCDSGDPLHPALQPRATSLPAGAANDGSAPASSRDRSAG